jgi:hypothetical protein
MNNFEGLSPTDEFIVKMVEAYNERYNEPMFEDDLLDIIDWITNANLTMMLLDMVDENLLGVTWDGKNKEPMFFLTEAAKERIKDHDIVEVENLLSSIEKNKE